MPATVATNDEPEASFWGCLALTTPRDRQNLRRFNLALAVWGIAFVGVSALLRFGALEGAAAWLVAVPPFSMAMIAIRHYVRFLREADELLRQVQMEGLALGFGAGFVFTTTWRLLERAGAPQLDVSDPLIVMVAFWALGQWFAARRYA